MRVILPLLLVLPLLAACATTEHAGEPAGQSEHAGDAAQPSEHAGEAAEKK